jgi:hypothetical protein
MPCLNYRDRERLPQVYVSLQVMCLLVLSCLQHNRNALTNFSEYPKCEVSQKCVWRELHCFMMTDGKADRRDEANNHLALLC